MTTAVVSDLHLGSRLEHDLLRLPVVRERLLAEITGAGEIVLLGDVVELRQRPLAEALEAARPFLERLREASGRFVLAPGNHDHQLAVPFLERRQLAQPGVPLPLAWRSDFEPTGPLGWLAQALAPAEVTLAYPGYRIREDVWATHGHYLDRHLTVPTLESIASGVTARLAGLDGDRTRGPDDYEAALAPMYAYAHGLAQRAGPVRANRNANVSVRVWKELNDPARRRRMRRRLLADAAIPAAVGMLNRAGLGPFGSDLSGAELRRASLRAMSEVVGRLEVGATHVIFGHTHRPGPLPGEDPWVTPSGASLHNTGSWVYEHALLGADPRQSPYWPGTVVMVPESGPPRLVRLLDDLTPADLAGSGH